MATNPFSTASIYTGKVDLELEPFFNIFLRLAGFGRVVSPRGLECVELVDFSYVLPPRVRFMNFKHRKLRLDYVKQEFVWYMRGDRFDASIAKIAAMWREIINPDGSINSNYGYYIFNRETAPGFMSNLDRVAKTLAKDPMSRRAVITILDNGHLCSETKDYPCTAYLNFVVRDKRLEMLVRMRSQDAIFGMGNDAPCFSFVHELLWFQLKQTMPGLELGSYHHVSDSFHIYERHYEMLKLILDDPVGEKVDCPVVDLPAESLQALCFTLKHHPESLTNIQVNEKVSAFGRWLLTRNDQATLL